ncbi:phosphoenolpyruvate carboxykinase (ATP) [Enterococcus cecorum]|uniref:phosphoenolpyruvate carboxykinase (ATP) n=1 Tax=Enterococcus cecorum TaxID=44008 RepID=UPI0032C496CF
MSTIQQFSRSEITKENPRFSPFKVLVESAFYGNHVRSVLDIQEAYEMAKNAPGTVVTDMPILHAKDLGLAEDTKILANNDGAIVGRTAAARVIVTEPGIDREGYRRVLREAVYQATKQEFYKTEVVVGLDEEFMVRSHLMLPKGFEMNLYSYMLNFQLATQEWLDKYKQSKPYPENDIYIFANPEWSHPDFPNGLALFMPEANVAAILGLRYFGELKKATLTLAWATAHRNGFVACHGGMKQYHLPDKTFTMAAFGLSGSGKSTITLAKHHDENSKVEVLHDDAFVINRATGSTTALEPSYFDKVQDYPLTDDAVNYFLTCQNVGITLDEEGKKVLVLEDVRNGNGRTVKSRYVTPNRVDHLSEKIDAIFWIMKDNTLPPVIKINNPTLAAVFGLTLATKRSTAENLVGKVRRDQLVIEPYANPFISYKLSEDYLAFRELFENQHTACYVLNTDEFNGKKVTKEVTLGSIEKIIAESGEFKPFGTIEDVEYLAIDGYPVDFEDKAYCERLKDRMETRLDFIQAQDHLKDGYHALPQETAELMRKIVNQLS